ncbi:hypothetical protein Tco_0403896 [Tanacetum coccineum]
MINAKMKYSDPPLDFWWNASSSRGLVRLLVLWGEELPAFLLFGVVTSIVALIVVNVLLLANQQAELVFLLIVSVQLEATYEEQMERLMVLFQCCGYSMILPVILTK